MSTEDAPDWWRPVGGENSQDSTLERRSLIWNDNNIEDGTIPAHFYDQPVRRGKFFTRGCRGLIEQLQLYCIGNGVDEITLRYSPHPGIGPFGEVTIAPAAAWAWQDFDVEEMWNYDSLFIWPYDRDNAVDWAYDEVQPYDGREANLAHQFWWDLEIRPFIRAVMTGETPGDVPVSGIVNTIEIPSIGTRISNLIAQAIPHNANVIAAGYHGAGTLLEVRATLMTSVTPTAGIPPGAVLYELSVYADGNLAHLITNRELTQSPIAKTGRCAVGEFWQGTVADPAWNRTVMTLRLPIKFRRLITIGLYQSSGGATTFDLMETANMVR